MGVHIGLLYNSDIYLYENDEPVAGLNIVPDVQAIYDAFFAQSMSEVVAGLLLANPQAIGELDYDDTKLRATVIGAGGSWQFVADPRVAAPTELQERVWAIPAAGFGEFRTLALQRLSTLPSGV